MLEYNAHYDPYDLWANRHMGTLKTKWQKGKITAKALLPALGVAELFFPKILRRIVNARPHRFPHILGMLISADRTLINQNLLDYFQETTSPIGGWGLPFSWHSKNGIYPPNTPFITNTPYVLEALLALSDHQSYRQHSLAMFYASWKFLKALKPLVANKGMLALSYAPVDEPRIVVNANSYAAFAHALHAIHGEQRIQEEARDRTKSLCRWVVQQQAEDGSWRYYADDQPGNFIDCFHSCFVVKNLLKTEKLLPELSSIVRPAIEKGWNYIQSTFPDPRSELCRRFSQRAQRDPFRWDLYDQAEYLGLLVDFGQLEEASEFARLVETRFRKDEHWYCRIDLLGRRWGRNFLRWGIVPFWYHQSRLQRALKTGTA